MKSREELLFLTGFMGSGKSTVGPALAETLGYGFVDVDELIENYEGRSINEIFALKGEKYFRTIERKILIDTVLKLSKFVVSLGGGTVTYEDNLILVKKAGILVYLKAEPETIFERVRFKTDRPLLLDPATGKNLPNELLLKRIETILKLREPFYSQSDIIVSTDNKPVGKIVEEILKHLDEKL